MRKSGSGIGIVMLVVVLAIVLLIVAKSWEKTGAAAIQVTHPDAPVVVDDHGETEAGDAVQQGRLPGLRDMRAETADHAKRLEEALAESE